ncbi:MAG: phage tail tube protein [Sphingorhabdus sp.]
MANKKQVWGESIIRVNGNQYQTEGKSTLEMGGKKREHVSADHTAGHFMQTTEPSKLTTAILVTADVSLAEINGWDDITASIEADTGQSYVINHAYVAEILSISEGKANLVIQGEPAVEVTL